MSSSDLQPRDTVKRDNFIETYQVHHAEGHKWYYLSGQMPQEAWVFLQADSSPRGMIGMSPLHSRERSHLTGTRSTTRIVQQSHVIT